MTWTKLHEACENGHFDDVVQLVKSHPEQVLRVDDHGSTPLHILFYLGDPDPRAVQALIDSCPQAASDQDHHGDTPLHIAVACPRTDQHLIQLLLNASSETVSMVNREGLMPLHMACRHAPHNEAVIALLVEKHPYALLTPIKMGSPPPGNAHKTSPPLRLVGKPHDHALIDPSGGMATKKSLALSYRYEITTHQVRDGAYPLHMAIQAGAPVKVLELLVREGDSILLKGNKFGETPLHVALLGASDHHETAIQFLLQCSPSEVTHMRDMHGNLPLHVAIKNGCSLRTIQRLLESFPQSIDKRTSSPEALTPLELAKHHGKCTDDVLHFLETTLAHAKTLDEP